MGKEGRTRYNLQFSKVRLDITGTGEFGRWERPEQGVRLASHDISWNVPARKEPDIDSVACPFRGVDAAARSIEAVTVGRVAGAGDATADIGTLARGLDVAVVCLEGAAEAGWDDGAAVAGVQGHFVGGLGVGALDDVDFAVVRPVGARHPANLVIMWSFFVWSG